MHTLADRIRCEIASAGPLPFARFMARALYDPDGGYYTRPDRSPGRHGDFFTSVSVGSLFGELWALQFSTWLESLAARDSDTPFSIIEAGAHDGQFASDVLGWLQTQRPALLERLRYVILEPLAARLVRQQAQLARFASQVQWIQDWAEVGRVQGVVFSNELLDAFPVQRLGWDAARKTWFEWGVGVQDERFVWTRLGGHANEAWEEWFLATSSGWKERKLTWPSVRLVGRASSRAGTAGRTVRPRAPWSARPARREPRPTVSRLSAVPIESSGEPEALAAVLPDGFTIEICPEASSWWSRAARALERGWLVTVDYGFEGHEQFEPQRRQGTLRAYRDHHLVDDVLSNPGLQDLTAHVDFAALRATGEDEGLRSEPLVSQGAFLTRLVAASERRPGGFGPWTPARRRQLQTLVHPGHLGRAFKILVQQK